MPSAPNETAAEDVRNALQLLRAEHLVPGDDDQARFRDILGGRGKNPAVLVLMDLDDLNATRLRLEAALAKLDATTAEERAIGRREHELGIMLDRADVVTGQPLDYERPGQVDPVLRGQEISEDPNYSGE